MKTGLENWAELHNTTADEIKILLLSEGHNPEQFLGDSLITAEPVPNGRNEALIMLLNRGRAGEIKVSKETIKNILDTDIAFDAIRSDTLPDTIQALAKISENTADNTTQSTAAMVETTENTADNITQSSAETGENTNESTAADEAQTDTKKPEEKEAKTEKKNEPVRRKTKYSMNKATADAMLALKFDAEIPSIRSIRAFLLSLPEYKAQDVAVMSDDEIQTQFTKNYVCANTEDGTLILSKSNCGALKEVLSRSDNYFVPQS